MEYYNMYKGMLYKRVLIFISACSAGYYMIGSTCTACPADHYTSGVNTAGSCSTCGTGHSTDGANAQTSCNSK